jgi:hypothetical protein
MFEPGVECPDCNVKLVHNRCKECGWQLVAMTVTKPLPQYREVPPPSDPTGTHDADPLKCTLPACREATCEAYVREQIAEGKRIAASPAWTAKFASQR